jgi:hypothetical protein
MEEKWWGAITVAAITLVVTGCATATGSSPTPSPDRLPQGGEQVTLDPADFTVTIDNPFWPMSPGTRWTYREVDATGTQLTVQVTVTTETKTIANGVVARVVSDTVFNGDAIVEDTCDWYAQDALGAIWYLGEDTAEFEDGALVSTEGSFEAGIDGALPGMIMPADPQPGMQYRQEYYKGEAEDNGAILSLNEMVDVPYGHFSGVVLTKDTSSIEPDVLEHKFYARGVGPVLTLNISGGSGGREELISVESVPDGAGTCPLERP